MSFNNLKLLINYHEINTFLHTETRFNRDITYLKNYISMYEKCVMRLKNISTVDYEEINVDNIFKLNKNESIQFSKIPVKYDSYMNNYYNSSIDIKCILPYYIGINVLFVLRKTKTRIFHKLYLIDNFNKDANDCISILKNNKDLFNTIIKYVEENNIEYIHGVLSSKEDKYSTEELYNTILNNYTVYDKLNFNILLSKTFDNKFIVPNSFEIKKNNYIITPDNLIYKKINLFVYSDIKIEFIDNINTKTIIKLSVKIGDKYYDIIINKLYILIYNINSKELKLTKYVQLLDNNEYKLYNVTLDLKYVNILYSNINILYDLLSIPKEYIILNHELIHKENICRYFLELIILDFNKNTIQYTKNEDIKDKNIKDKNKDHKDIFKIQDKDIFKYLLNNYSSYKELCDYIYDTPIDTLLNLIIEFKDKNINEKNIDDEELYIKLFNEILNFKITLKKI